MREMAPMTRVALLERRPRARFSNHVDIFIRASERRSVVFFGNPGPRSAQATLDLVADLGYEGEFPVNVQVLTPARKRQPVERLRVHLRGTGEPGRYPNDARRGRAVASHLGPGPKRRVHYRPAKLPHLGV